jgi:hypothetical protein
VSIRTVVGRAAPERAREHAASIRSSIATAGVWSCGRRKADADAHARLVATARRLASR